MPLQVDLRYGTGEIPVTLPDHAKVTVIRKPTMPVIANPGDAVARVLNQSVSSPALIDLAAGAKTACIAICDITRPVPNHLFLRPVIQQLLSSGVPASGITVLIATGLHRPNEGDELKALIGDPWVTDNVQVINHFARNDADHVTLGRTETRGTVVRIDKRFVGADLRIVTGLVEPHFMAGYSGGRKLIAPGLAHAETITTFHSSRFMADPAATNCNFLGNPLHEEQLEIVRMVGECYAVNTIINEERQLSFINFGEIIASHSEAVDFVRRYCEISIDRKFHTVLTSAAGYPLDKTYYQTIKGMVGPIDILADGGDLIIASQCSEGLGSPEFVDAQQRLIRLGTDAFLQSIMTKPHADIDEWQTQMQLKPMSIGNVQLFSDRLSAVDQALTGVAKTDDIDLAVSESLQRSPDQAIAIIPEGPYVVPIFRPQCGSR